MIQDNLIYQVGIYCSKSSNKFKYELTNRLNLFRLHEVLYNCQKLWVEEVWLDNEACILDHSDESVQGHLSFLEVTLILHRVQNQREDLSDIRLGCIRIHKADFSHYI